MEKLNVDPNTEAYRLVNPGACALISVGDGKRDNLFPVTWNTVVRKSPGMIAVVSGKGHFSYPFIERTGELGVNIPSVEILDALYGCGKTTGAKVDDKFTRFGLTRQEPRVIRAPLVAEAVGNLECKVCQVVDLGSSALLIAQVLAATASSEHFRDGDWRFENGLKLVHHLTGERFCLSGEEAIAKKP